MAENDIVRGNFAQRLRQRTVRKCRHYCVPQGGVVTRRALKVHPERQTRRLPQCGRKNAPKELYLSSLAGQRHYGRQSSAWHE